MFSTLGHGEPNNFSYFRPFAETASQLELAEEAEYYKSVRQPRLESPSRRKVKLIVWVSILCVAVYFLACFNAKWADPTGRSTAANETMAHAHSTSSSDLLVNSNGTATFRGK
jgi:hypothetical protein